MNEFYVVPKADFKAKISAIDKDAAIVTFAAIMDSDMNNYFQAVTKEEFDALERDKIMQDHVKYIKDWMQNEFLESFEDVDEDDVEDLADQAYEIYCQGDGYTEYESLQEAYRRYSLLKS